VGQPASSDSIRSDDAATGGESGDGGDGNAPSTVGATAGGPTEGTAGTAASVLPIGLGPTGAAALPLLAAAVAVVAVAAPGARARVSNASFLTALLASARADDAGGDGDAHGAAHARDALTSIANKWTPPLLNLECARALRDVGEAARGAGARTPNSKAAALGALGVALAIGRGLHARAHAAAAPVPAELFALARATAAAGGGGAAAADGRLSGALCDALAGLLDTASAARSHAAPPSAALASAPQEAVELPTARAARARAALAGPLSAAGGAVVSAFRAQRLLAQLLPLVETALAPVATAESSAPPAPPQPALGCAELSAIARALGGVVVALPEATLCAHAPRVAAALARALARAWAVHTRALPPPPPPPVGCAPAPPPPLHLSVAGFLPDSAAALAALGALRAVQQAQIALAGAAAEQEAVGARLGEHASSLLELLSALAAGHAAMLVR
jgi:hypothetical protein